MKTLAAPSEVVAMRHRLSSLTPSDTALWGRMTVGQMLCHLTDAFRLTLGERAAAPVKTPIPVPLLKWLALQLPIRWAHGIATTPEMNQDIGGTQPSVFAADHATLLEAFDRFILDQRPRPHHPFFGSLTSAEWNRWAYLHTDHHLRQFGR